MSASASHVFDIEIPAGWNVGVFHRVGGDWTITYYRKQYAKKAVTVKGCGQTFEAAMVELKQNIQKRDHV